MSLALAVPVIVISTVRPLTSADVVKRKPSVPIEPLLSSVVPKGLCKVPERVEPCCVSFSVPGTVRGPTASVSVHVPERLLLLEGGVFGCVVDGVREGVAAGVAAGRVPLNVPGARPTVCTVPRISLPVIVPVKVASVV